MAFDQPLLVIPPPEFAQGLDQLHDRGEAPDPKQVLLQGANESFRDAIGLRSRMHLIRTISLDVPV